MNDRKIWTQYEDESLAEVVNLIGTENWTSVADLMSEKFGIKDRSGKKCRERWINHLKPDVSKAPWSEDEMKILIRSQGFYGNQWTEIAKFLPGRTDNSVKNFFYTTLRKKIRLFNKSCPAEEVITLSINDVSLNPELTKKVLQVSGKKNNNKILPRYLVYRRTSERLRESQQTKKSDSKVLSEMPNFESFETCCSMNSGTFSGLPKVTVPENVVVLEGSFVPFEMMSFDFSRY